MKSFEERLEAESTTWVRDDLITPEQRQRLLARHPVASAGRPNHFFAVLAMIGGALFVVGVSLIIKSNWEAIGDWVKIGGLVALLVGSQFAGWRLKLAPGHFPKTGDACFMIAAVLFFLGIVLVSQIYHLNSRPPNGVLLWWVGIAALPWLTRARGTQFVSITAWFIWLMMELATRDSWIRLMPDRRQWYDNDFLAFGGAAFLIGVALYFFGEGLRKGRHADFADLHGNLGLLVATGALYTMGLSWSSHRWSYQAMEAARPECIGFLVLLAAATVAWTFWRNRAVLAHLGLPLLLGLVPALAILGGIELHDSGWLWGGLACLAMFVLNLWMIRSGLSIGRESWINLGVLGIAVNIITRYFLVFGTMLEGGVFFAVTGLLVVGLGYFLERQRRRLVSTVRKEVAS